MMTKVWGIISVILLLMIGVVGFVNVNQDSVSSDSVTEAEQQLEAVMAVGRTVTREPLHIIIKWQGTWNTSHKPEEAAKLAADQLGLSSPASTQVQDHLVYRSEDKRGPLNIKLSVTQGNGQNLFVVAQIEGLSKDEASSRWRQAQSSVGKTLMDLGMDLKWNAAIQGNGELLSEGEAVDVTALLNKLERQAGSYFELRRVEGFQDGITISESYEVPSFPISVQSSGVDIALQMAIHDNTVSGQTEFSLGSPVLTVEY